MIEFTERESFGEVETWAWAKSPDGQQVSAGVIVEHGNGVVFLRTSCRMFSEEDLRQIADKIKQMKERCSQQL